MRIKVYLIFLLTFFTSVHFLLAQGKESVKFKASDGVDVYADLYMPYVDSATFIILFHQAGWSRGEYEEIALKLNEIGFNCMAVDLRSGNTINGVMNQTNMSARQQMKETLYIHSLPDMQAAVSHAREFLASQKLIVWGSSYSAALSLVIAAEMPDKVDGVIAFSPGEYFKSMGKAEDYVHSHAAQLEVPVFLTGARSEREIVESIHNSISNELKVLFVPGSSGNHGSRALWGTFPDSREYWRALRSFLVPFLD